MRFSRGWNSASGCGYKAFFTAVMGHSKACAMTHCCSRTAVRRRHCVPTPASAHSAPLFLGLPFSHRLRCPHPELQPLSRQPFSNFLPKAPPHPRGVCSGRGLIEGDACGRLCKHAVPSKPVPVENSWKYLIPLLSPEVQVYFYA